ncbi:hypothetical protein CHISP_3582 [Chitinispirillum alkaliphilum]|nr:hypothetical protein CHISP_3582 [Chitinispirillum alkaliphilum]
MKCLKILVALTVVVSVLGCFSGSAKFVNVQEHGPIAMVSFSLDNSIVPEGAERCTGPGLLQDEEKYYENHVKTAEALLEIFSDNLRGIFLDANFLDQHAVLSNEQYQELTKHVPRIVMGQDIAPGRNMITVGGFNYVSAYSRDILENLTEILDVEMLLLIENTLSYEMSRALISSGISNALLNTTVYLYQKGEGIVFSNTFRTSSDEALTLIAGTASTERYPVVARSAGMKIIEEIRSHMIYQKEMAESLAAESH